MQGSKKVKKMAQSSDEELEIESEESTLQRGVSIIESTIRKQQLYYEGIRGDRQETKELNIHMKTLNEKYLKRCMMANELGEEDRAIYDQYKTMSANFETTAFLFESLSQQTKEMCRRYVRSTQIVKDIMKSDRMFFNNKIIFSKFLKKVEAGIDIPNVSWKPEYFKNKKRGQRSKDQAIKMKAPEPRVNAESKMEQNRKKSFSNPNVKRANGDMSIRVEMKQQIKQGRDVPAFGQTRFGGGFVFPISNNQSHKNDG